MIKIVPASRNLSNGIAPHSTPSDRLLGFAQVAHSILHVQRLTSDLDSTVFELPGHCDHRH